MNPLERLARWYLIRRATPEALRAPGFVGVTCIGGCHDGAEYIAEIGPEPLEGGRTWTYLADRGWICSGCLGERSQDLPGDPGEEY